MTASPFTLVWTPSAVGATALTALLGLPAWSALSGNQAAAPQPATLQAEDMKDLLRLVDDDEVRRVDLEGVPAGWRGQALVGQEGVRPAEARARAGDGVPRGVPPADVGEHLVDRAAFGARAVQLAQRLLELGLRGDPVGELVDARKHLRHHPGTTHGLRIDTHDHQAVGRLFERDPALLDHELTLEGALQSLGADAAGVEGLVGNAEKACQRGADLGRADLEIRHQHMLDRLGVLTRLLDALGQLCELSVEELLPSLS